MLDPSLPWLAAGYHSFKQKDFCRPRSAVELAHYRYLEEGSNHPELRPTTQARYQNRRVKSATHLRVHNYSRLSRPRSARSTENLRNEKVGCNTYAPEQGKARSLSRRPKSTSAALLCHRPSAAQNKSVTEVERLHHQERLIRHYVEETGEEVQHKCDFCPVECRPMSSSSNRPTSSTGLLAAHLPSHIDRMSTSSRPKTAPTTRREFLRLPIHNNVRRGKVPYYTNFVSKLHLHVRDRTPSPRTPRRRHAFQEEQRSVSPDYFADAFPADEEILDEYLPGDDRVGEDDLGVDDVAEPFQETSIHVPSPVEIPAEVDESKDEPPGEALEAWPTETTAPTPSPAVSGRGSPQEVQSETTQEEPPIIVEKPPSPIPSVPSTPPRQPSPPLTPKQPTPPPAKSPTPPPKSPTLPPPQLTSRPPRECTHKPKAPIPPLPKVKKEVRIQEPPTLGKNQSKEKMVEKKEKKPIDSIKRVTAKPAEEPPKQVPLKPSLKKTPSETETPKLEPSPLPSLPAEAPEPQLEAEPQVEETVQEKPARDETDSGPAKETQKESTPPVEEKKKLGPPPKVKVDLFSMDPQAMKELLDIQMKLKRKGPSSIMSDEDVPHPSLADLVEPTTRMLKQNEWLRGRIALSRRAARFELPMNVGDLADMSPVEYLNKYCIISQRRRTLYKKAFSRTDKNNDGKLNRKELEKAVLDALVDTIQPDQVTTVLGHLGAEDTEVFNSRFFASFCALLERLYYSDFSADDMGEKKEEKEKQILEEADFSGLDWKLHCQYVNPALKNLLYML